MPLTIGTRLGHHEILSALGAGAMGEVYRATDTRLKRQVAIKILPSDFAGDAGRLARFQREAEVLASLNHPHIASIYGLEEAGGVKALVMELVDGPTLADRIARGPIAIEEALPIARQIAEALEAAHEQGIVHRDLKPANIKVRDDGTVKVLDFGLAKARSGAGDPLDAGATMMTSSVPTIASGAPFGSSGQSGGAGVSQTGAILGTAAYMSPEQARGQTVDKRTDVWAFGAILYEMLTGAPAFAGDNVGDLIAAVLKTAPDWAALPADVPPQIVTLIQRCLEKDRRTRIGDVAVARFVLSGDATAARPLAPVHAPIAAASRWRSLLPSIAAAAVVGAALGWLLPRRGDAPRPIARLQMDVAPAEMLAPGLNSYPRPSRTAMALSPDGSRIAFAGLRDRVRQLFVRDLDRPAAASLAGTEGAASPFFSPDGEWIGFVADNKIKKVPTGGGATAVICDVIASQFWGAAWADDGSIFFGARGGIFKVPSGGGTPAAITTVNLAKGERHLLPQPLPGSKALLVTDPPNVALVPLDSGERRTILEGASDARYVPTGHLVFVKNATLMAVPFDVRARQVTGAAVALVDGMMQAVGAPNGTDETFAGQFAISRAGTLVYVDGGIFPTRQGTLVWADRRGAAQPLAGVPPRPYLQPRLSPDGRRGVVDIRREGSRDTDLWVYDASRGSSTRLTFDGGGQAVWSPDGTRLVYAGVGSNLYVVNADGSGKPERLTESAVSQVPTSWARGTNTVAFLQRPTSDTFGIWMLPMDRPARTPTLAIESRFPLSYAELSPDGQWIAYVSTESGSAELYVQPYPGSGGKTRVSTSGGGEPIWIRSGRELLYRAFTPSGLQVLSAPIRSLSPFRVDEPLVLFERKAGEYDSTGPVRGWDATADGQRFLFVRVNESSDKPVTTMHVVLNWQEELKQRVPTR